MPQTQEEHLIALEDEKEDSDSEHSTPAGPDVEVIILMCIILYIAHTDTHIHMCIYMYIQDNIVFPHFSEMLYS